MKQDIEEKIDVPEGITIGVDNNTITVKGPKGEIKRARPRANLDIVCEGTVVKLQNKKATKREKKQLYTTCAHVKNMLIGVKEPFKYVLKICSGHFPMNVSLSAGNFVIKNFLGEKFPRTMHIKNGVAINIQGDKITVESPNKDLAGQTASEIELLSRVTKRDTRVFQDGIYLIEKPGEKNK